MEKNRVLRRTALSRLFVRLVPESGIKAAVDDTLRALEKSGEAEKIFLKWYGPGTKANFDKRSFKFETDEIGR